MEKKTKFTLSGAAIASVAGMLLAGGIFGKEKSGAARTGMLASGLGGILLGAAVAYHPEKEAKKQLVAEELLDDADAELMEQNVSEVLGSKE